MESKTHRTQHLECPQLQKPFNLEIYEKKKSSTAESIKQECLELRGMKSKKINVIGYVSDGHSINKSFAKMVLKKSIINFRALFTLERFRLVV